MTANRTEQNWLDSVRTLLLCGQVASAQTTLTHALAEFPASADLRRVQAGIFQRAGHPRAAEQVLRELLKQNAGDTASAFALAELLKKECRSGAAAAVMRECFAGAQNSSDVDLAIRAIELLDDCDRKADAASIAAVAIEANPHDPRLHAYAGMLQIQLGKFEPAQQHYRFALEHDERAWEWHIPISLSSAQHYENGEHSDFALFRNGLQHESLSDKARAELHFALGKSHDDVGNYEQAARHFREGNAIAHRLTKWSRKAWRRTVEARLASKPIACALETSTDFTPVFIVGMPRSGTTLLATLLSHYPRVCNRGELKWIARIAERPALNGTPDRASLQEASASYAAQARRDDAGDARWFIDKQPLNFRYIDLILALFPQAKIIHCRRDARDTALSLWMQCFLEEVQGYSYDFDDIAIVMSDCDRLMAHWRELYPGSIRALRYETLVASPEDVMSTLASWIGVPRREDGIMPTPSPGSAISSASLWQARQPVNTQSVARWKNYVSHLPELLRIQEG